MAKHNSSCLEWWPKCQCLKCAKNGGGCCLRHRGQECDHANDCPDFEPEKEITIKKEEKA